MARQTIVNQEPEQDEQDEHEDDEENEDDTEVSPEEEEYIRRQQMAEQGAQRRPQRGEAARYRPVSNAEDVPLFPDSDNDMRNTIAYLRIIRQSKPKAGYKGQLPPNSTLENIALLHGNGVYTIEACAEDHTVLRRRQNVLLAVEEANPQGDARQAGNGGDAISELIRDTQQNHSREIDRVHALTERASKQEADRGREYTSMVRETAKESREALQIHYQTAAKNQQDFFGALMAAQNMSFQQTMLIMNKSHEMQVQMMRESGERNNPMVYVQMMMQGLQMGRELNDGNDDPDWIKGMREGGDMLTNLLKLKSENSTTSEPDSEPEPEVQPKRRRKNPPGTTQSGKKVFEVDELRKMLELKEILRGQGIDLGQWLGQAKLSYHKEPDTEQSAEDDAEQPTNDDSGDETPEDVAE